MGSHFQRKNLQNGSFFDCILKPHHSPIWRDILKGRFLLEKGVMIGIGDERSTFLWYHHWIGSGPLYKIIKMINRDIPDSVGHLYVCDIIK